jgi:methionyl-tRNA synthetase
MTLGQEEKMLLVRINRELKQYISLLENAKLRDAIKPIFSISRLGNQLMQAAQPWVLIKSTKDEEKMRAGTVIGLCANIICQLSVMLLPFMPNLSGKLQEQLGVTSDVNHLIPEFTCRLPAGHRIGKPAPLFQKIEQSLIDELKQRFSGAQVGSAAPPGNPAVTPVAEEAASDSLENLALKVAQQVTIFHLFCLLCICSNIFLSQRVTKYGN